MNKELTDKSKLIQEYVLHLEQKVARQDQEINELKGCMSAMQKVIDEQHS